MPDGCYFVCHGTPAYAHSQEAYLQANPFLESALWRRARMLTGGHARIRECMCACVDFQIFERVGLFRVGMAMTLSCRSDARVCR